METKNKVINTTQADAAGKKESDLIKRIRANKPSRWIRFGIVTLIFIAWVAWLGSWWVLIFLPLLFDIYITGYIPFTWWKKSKSATVRTIMSWVDAIVYALILVYFVFTFIGQNYQIPSSSLEKSLLVGDYLVVNKMAYGPRVPMTPVHFPLVQNTFPVINTKSYVEWPQWKYHRLQGLGNVERGDIVVFNFPAGDTVALKVQNPDYYTLIEEYGRERVNNDKATFGEVIYRPVDRRENYVKRAVGLPGERLKITDGIIYINGEPQKQPENVQFNYFIQVKNRNFTDRDWEDLGVAVADRMRFTPNIADMDFLAQNGFITGDPQSMPSIYITPLTDAMVKKLQANPNVNKVFKMPAMPNGMLYPRGIADEWTTADYGEIWIPSKGSTIELNPDTWARYNRCIRNYEYNFDYYLGQDGKVHDGSGKVVDRYTFQMDYYFMVGDNRDNSLDSRFWGLVPEDHIVGRPEMVLVSFDPDKGFPGIRWDRIFKWANPDK